MNMISIPDHDKKKKMGIEYRNISKIMVVEICFCPSVFG